MNLKQPNEMTVILNAATVEGDASAAWALDAAGYIKMVDGKRTVDRKRLIADLKANPKVLRYQTVGVGKKTYYTIIRYLLETV